MRESRGDLVSIGSRGLPRNWRAKTPKIARAGCPSAELAAQRIWAGKLAENMREKREPLSLL